MQRANRELLKDKEIQRLEEKEKAKLLKNATKAHKFVSLGKTNVEFNTDSFSKMTGKSSELDWFTFENKIR
mgnify:CR=1